MCRCDNSKADASCTSLHSHNLLGLFASMVDKKNHQHLHVCQLLGIHIELYAEMLSTQCYRDAAARAGIPCLDLKLS